MSKKFKIGLFGINSNSGIAMTKVKNRWEAKWEDIKTVVEICDKSEIDFIFSVQRWLGFDGATNPAGLTYDSLSFSSALASISKKIEIYATLHVPLIHPTFAARALSTIDQISNGRVALNIVCGWNEKEFNMFGIKNNKYIDRYKQGEEWLKVLNKILDKKEFSPFKGKYFNIKYSTSSPKLFKRKKLNITSAAFSDKGRLFAAKNCDQLITMFSNLTSAKKQIQSIKRKSKVFGRKIKVLGLAHVVCRKSNKEAEEYYNFYAAKMADKKAIDNFIGILNNNKKNNVFSNLQKMQIKKMAGGIGSYPLIGSPKKIIEEIYEFKKIGLDGFAISFVNYKDELPYFINSVIRKLNL